MANVILPIASFWLTLGGTIDLLTYDTGSRYSAKSIFRDSDFIENPVDILNSTYYVVQEGKLPYSAMGLPIDLVRRVKSDNFNPSSSTDGIPTMVKKSISDQVLFLTITEYRTVEQSIKENAVPISQWQESVPKTQTHYADKMHYGGKCISMANIVSNYTGDIQVIRRLLTDVMGSSGPIGEDTIGLWRRALRTVNESPDVRGITYFSGFGAECRNVQLPTEALWSLESFLEKMAIVKNLTGPYNSERHVTPISVNFKPLRSLDNEYPALEKNKVSEEYLTLLDEMVDDLDLTKQKLRRVYISRENRHILRNFSMTVNALRNKIRALSYDEISIYKDLDEELFEDAFESYEAGLYKRGKNYYISLKKLIEDLAPDCGTSFLKPTSGILETSEDELLSKGSVEGGLEECKEQCRTNERCRAIGYVDIFPYECHIYSRSTITANILSPLELPLMKVYDRKC